MNREESTTGGLPARFFTRAWPALLLLIGALPRIAGLDDFLTTDEAYHWIGRVERFNAAVAAGRWAETLQTGHPGVTLMWLGSLGLTLERALVGEAANIPAHLAWLRLPVALINALLLPLIYLLLRRLLGAPLAAVAALLIATTPWLVALGRLLHLDALLAGFVTLSLLMVLAAGDGGRGTGDGGRYSVHVGWLFGSGLCAGLALLTKGPALILLPAAGLLLFWGLLERRPAAGPGNVRLTAGLLGHTLLYSLLLYSLWLGVALVLVGLLWPALWADAPGALGRYFGEILSNGGRPNGDGQFFLGKAVGDPGALFYPLAGLFRLTPLETVGLLALPLAFFGVYAAPQRNLLLKLLAFVIFWFVVMALGPKKFDRYVLPAWPVLLILVAAGLVALGRWIVERWRQRSSLNFQPLALSLVLLLQIPLLLWYHPYYLSYYNPLLGGGAAAQRVLLIGWGEGMDQVGAYLRGRADSDHGQVLSALGQTLQPFVAVPVRNVTTLDSRPPANYAVVYLESLQRGAFPAIYARIRETVPLQTITIHGIEYAWIHQLPRPFVEPVGATFADVLRLRGVTVERSAGRLIITPAWDVRAVPPADYLAFVHLIDAQGRRVAQIDVAPGGEAAPATGQWQPGQQIGVPLPLPLPAELPAGRYSLIMGLYDPAGGQRASVRGGTPADPAIAGPDALLLTVIEL